MKHKITRYGLLVLLASFPFLGYSSAKAPKKDKGNYSYCVAIKVSETSASRLARSPEKYATPIPKGWTVVGTSGGDKLPKVIVCRR